MSEWNQFTHVCNKECGFSWILGFFTALKPLTSASIGTLEHSVDNYCW